MTNRDGRFAEYRFELPGDGTWHLWYRAFRGAFRYRFDDGPWHSSAEAGRPLSDLVVVREEGRYWTAAWRRLASVDLQAGTHTLRIESDEKAGNFGIDAFMLAADKDLRPHGRLKPGEQYDRAEEGWFAFEPGHDTFKPTPFDLSDLNHRPAGVKGRVQRDGGQFVFVDGEPVRFWGVTAGTRSWLMDPADMDRLGRRLAKRGVNLIRMHISPFDEMEPGPKTRGILKFVAAMKRHGIYVAMNWFCTTENVKADWQIPGTEAGDPTSNLIFASPEFRDHYRQRVRTLFGTVNPETGMTLAEDPAVAFVELVDEDSTLFWTFRPERLPDVMREHLERRFAQWLEEEYGSLDQAQRAWGPVNAQFLSGEDAPAAGRMALYPSMRLGGAAWMAAQRNLKRASDQLRFQVHLQRDFYGGMKRWMREEFGYEGLMVASNWKTVDERVLGPLEQHSYAAVDITARNTYFSGQFKRHKFHPWMPGDLFTDRSMLRDPQAAITSHVQLEETPHALTEGGYAMPNRFRTEEQLIMASYGALQGIDALCPFSLENTWNLEHERWPIQTPVTLGQYPAAALIYRQGLVREGPVVIREALKLEDLYRFEGGAVSQPLGLDAFKAEQLPEGESGEVASLETVDPLAFYVGRVVRAIGNDPGASSMHGDLAELIDSERKQVRSATGELMLDYDRGLMTVAAVKAQGATGFLADAGSIDLPQLSIDLDNEYGAVILVPLDDAPLDRSQQMLLQVFTEDRAYDFRTETVMAKFSDDGPEVQARKMLTNGRPPMMVRQIDGSVALKRTDAATLTVTPLDLNGYPRAEPIRHGPRIDLEPDVVYYLIEKP